MSLLSRNTGGRRVATMATVFVGTLLTYLVLTAIPALAVTTCTATTVTNADDRVTVNVGTDDNVVLAENASATEVLVSVNGAALASCSGDPIVEASTDWLEIVGSNAGNERVTIHSPENSGDWGGWTTTVNLGNGSDFLTFEYGAIASLGLAEDADSFINLRQSGSAIAVDVTGASTSAEVRIDNAETLIVNGGSGVSGLCASRTSAFGDCDVDLTTQATNIAATTGDDISLPATAPISQNTTLNGGAGDDVLASGNGNDNFQGGPGSDVVDYEASATGVTVDLVAATGTGMGNDTLADVQDVNGSDFDDVITGNTLDNDLQGNDGDDALNGGAGDDDINGDDGDDIITGGAGDDEVDGDDGDDVINEEATANGSDDLDGDAGIDEINYGARTTNTVVVEGGGFVSGQDANNDGDASDAGDERDLVIDFEVFVTGSGNDTLVGNGDAETFVPGAGNDSVDGNAGTDLLDISAAATATINLETGTATGEGSDTFTEVEQFITGAGNDVVIPDIQTGLPAGFDWFADGGIDTVDGSTNTGGFAVDLSNLGGPTGCKAGAGLGLCTDVEDATGGSGNDALTGSAISNVLIGGAGFDTISAGGGNDFVEGGAGNDTLTGGSGADFLSYVNAPSGEVIDMQLGFASGGDGDDAIGFFEIILGSDFADEITGGQTFLDANLRVRGRGGNDFITGTNSSDTLAGGGGNDVVRAGGGDDVVRLGAGNDVGAGSSGDDVIRGAGGDDRLLGGSGDDFLFGGRGRDLGNGGAGADTCRTEVRRSC